MHMIIVIVGVADDSDADHERMNGITIELIRIIATVIWMSVLEISKYNLIVVLLELLLCVCCDAIFLYG